MTDRLRINELSERVWAFTMYMFSTEISNEMMGSRQMGLLFLRLSQPSPKLSILLRHNIVGFDHVYTYAPFS